MNNLRHLSLVAALLAGLSALGASAAEAHLSPNSNGGSGAMPSGYSALHFNLKEGDWAEEIKLPANPQPGDEVLLTSESNRMARLDASGTSFKDLVYLPVGPGTQLSLFWDPHLNSWLVLGGYSAQFETTKPGMPELSIPPSGYPVTQVDDSGWKFTAINLPDAAPQGAQLAISGRQLNDILVRSRTSVMVCAAAQACAYVFDFPTGRWHPRSGVVEISASQVDLLVPANRWTTVMVGSPAHDLQTPGMLRLPASGVDGDVYEVKNLSGDHFAYILADNTDLGDVVPLSSGVNTFYFDAGRRIWMHQAK